MNSITKSYNQNKWCWSCRYTYQTCVVMTNQSKFLINMKVVSTSWCHVFQWKRMKLLMRYRNEPDDNMFYFFLSLILFYLCLYDVLCQSNRWMINFTNRCFYKSLEGYQRISTYLSIWMPYFSPTITVFQTYQFKTFSCALMQN